jgi:[ribosomal protein S5]-alanine N-acetyltransferase
VAERATASRVRLERASPRRLREFLDAVDRSRRLHGQWVAPPASAPAYRKYLARARRPGQRGYFIVRRDTNALAGVVNVSEIVRGNFQSAYLGYYAFTPHAAQGFMREGLALVLDAAFARLKLHRLEANIQPANTNSVRLVQALGFRLEGLSPRYLKIANTWRDHERWALLADDWTSARGRVVR